ncbi:ATP-binding protein, partial [Paenibacillus nuruki]|uniref:ATP-binding protein n=1 Tax=Paenibacillus nuruki TaxID=1886670 RepID=UPI001112F59E
MDIKEYYEATINESTNKIFNEFKNINQSGKEKKDEIRRRWIWELIQNASDCTPEGKKINISVEVTEDEIHFSHDGIPFSYENLFSLITQISAKPQSEESLTGKFGTGFMTTFLLSEVVEIEGSFIRKDGNWTNMKFLINRENQDYKGIREKTVQMLNNLQTLNENSDENLQKLNRTKFIYSLKGSPESMRIVKQGADDLQATLLYLLAFNPNINSITYNSEIYELDRSYNTDNFITLKGRSELGSLYLSTNNNVTIACPMKIDASNLYVFLPIPENMPKLFCKFPLIGTEQYSFPIIINSDLFDVEIDRNAIREGNSHNKLLINEAI